MKMRRWLTVALLTTTWGAAVAAERHATIVYSANLNGELEPCGCAEESNLGGIRRQASKVLEWRKAQPNLFLISSGGLLVSELPSDRIKSEFILKGFAALKYDAVGVQWRDLAYGPKMLQTEPVPWVSTNAAEGDFAKVQRTRH